MKKSRFAAALIAVLTAGALILTACGLFATRIGDITTDPRAYEGKVVTVSGTVKSKLNLVLVKAFTVADDSGEIAVTTKGEIPPLGEKVRIKGKVNRAFSVGDKSLVLIEAESP